MSGLPPFTWIIVGLLLLALAWLGWRHMRLARAINAYEQALRIDPSGQAASTYLRSLSLVVRQMAADRTRELAAVLSERDRLAAVLDQLTDGVLIADAQGQIRYSNPAAATIFESPSPIGRSVTETLRDHRLVGAWQRAQASSGMQSETVELPRRRQLIQLIAVPDLHAGGTLLLVQDLTRLRRLETVRQDFVSNVSHELRTPLASIRALAETLMDGAVNDPEAAPRFLGQMIAEVDALTQMSQELLDLASIESGKAGLNLEKAAPQLILQAAADRMRLQAERAELALRIEGPDSLPAVNADPARLGQVIVNLVHNSIKFTRAGGQIVIGAKVALEPPSARPTFVEFSVRDTGKGIPADDLPRIFERFYRADKARTSGGTGLGLSIARHIVEAHGGRIWAESVEGQGSTFYFTIPLAA